MNARASTFRTVHHQNSRDRQGERKHRAQAKLPMVLVQSPAPAGQMIDLKARCQQYNSREDLKAQHGALPEIDVQVVRTGRMLSPAVGSVARVASTLANPFAE